MNVIIGGNVALIVFNIAIAYAEKSKTMTKVIKYLMLPLSLAIFGIIFNRFLNSKCELEKQNRANKEEKEQRVKLANAAAAKGDGVFDLNSSEIGISKSYIVNNAGILLTLASVLLTIYTSSVTISRDVDKMKEDDETERKLLWICVSQIAISSLVIGGYVWFLMSEKDAELDITKKGAAAKCAAEKKQCLTEKGVLQSENSRLQDEYNVLENANKALQQKADRNASERDSCRGQGQALAKAAQAIANADQINTNELLAAQAEISKKQAEAEKKRLVDQEAAIKNAERQAANKKAEAAERQALYQAKAQELANKHATEQAALELAARQQRDPTVGPPNVVQRKMQDARAVSQSPEARAEGDSTQDRLNRVSVEPPGLKRQPTQGPEQRRAQEEAQMKLKEQKTQVQVRK